MGQKETKWDKMGLKKRTKYLKKQAKLKKYVKAVPKVPKVP